MFQTINCIWLFSLIFAVSSSELPDVSPAIQLILDTISGGNDYLLKDDPAIDMEKEVRFFWRSR